MKTSISFSVPKINKSYQINFTYSKQNLKLNPIMFWKKTDIRPVSVGGAIHSRIK